MLVPDVMKDWEIAHKELQRIGTLTGLEREIAIFDYQVKQAEWIATYREYIEAEVKNTPLLKNKIFLEIVRDAIQDIAGTDAYIIPN